MTDSQTTEAIGIQRAVMFGCGNMGQALISGWVESPLVSFSIVDPMEPSLDIEARVVGNTDDLSDTEFNLVIIAVKPQLIPTVMEESGDMIRKADLVLSIAAGVSMETLEKHIGDLPIVRMMPNLPAAVGKGMSGLYANDKCSDKDKSLITDMASRNGELVWLQEEDQIDRFTAIAGSGPGYIFEFLRLYTMAAMEQGFSEEDARKLAIATVAGTTEMAAQSDKSLDDLRSSVTSKNGTTQAGLEQFMRNDELKTLLSDTVAAAYKRAVELR